MIKTETVGTDSFTMDFFRFGRGDGTLVILPGLSVQSVTVFADAIADAYRPLADDFTVYVFDRRKDMPDAYSVYDMARDTAEAIRALGLGEVCLFGASQGGMIALKIALDCPKLVKKLILCSTSSWVLEDQFEAVGRWIELAEAGDAEGLYLAFGEAIYPRDVFERSRSLLCEAAKSVTKDELRRFVISAKGMRRFDVINYLKRIDCPTFVAGSSDDRVLGADAVRQISGQLQQRPDHVFHMYNGYGHAVYDTAPDFRERMLRFLKDVEAR